MNPSTALATALVDELIGQGVCHAVLCPGSRSAPLAYALQEADRAGRLTLHVRVDERSAGFLALGLAKLTRVPAVVVTTSGTAVANLHPAVLEAHHGVVPLVLLTADRPVELRGTGANQTTVQPGMFGPVLRWECDVPAPQSGSPAPQPGAGEESRWREVATTAVARATGAGGEPGPVHVNAQFREPLVPTDEPSSTQPLVDREEPAPSTGSRQVATAAGPMSGRAPDDAARGGRTLVVIGDLPEPGQFDQALAWARSHGWPVVAEPFGQHPRDGALPHGPLLLTVGSWLDDHAPERVITVGRVTLARPVAALLRRQGVRLEAVRTHQWIESTPAVHRLLDPAVLEVLGDGAQETGWDQDWQGAGRTLARAVSSQPSPWGTGQAVARTMLDELPSGAMFFVGSSTSVRDLDLAAGHRRDPLTVVASRGLAGIDGCVSTAAGIALASAAPAYALMGDLTFLHDANGLMIGPHEPRPDLTLVVVNDDGGGIFTLLEPGEPGRASDFERIFGTPTGTDLESLCRAHDVPHELAGSREQLAAALRKVPEGLRVVEVRLDRSGHRAEQQRLRDCASAALSSD